MFEAKVLGENPELVDGEATQLKPLETLSDEEFASLARSILVVIPHRSGEGICAGLCTHFGMWGRIGMRLALLKDPFGGFIEMTRGGIVRMFLDMAQKYPELRYCVMIDNDETVNWDAPLRLALHGKPIVSGVVCGYNDERGIFACFTVPDESGVPRFPSYRETKYLPSGGLIEAYQVGTGLLCVRRDVLERLKTAGEEPFMLPETIRRESINDGNLKKSEDVVFAERARKYGFQSYVDLGVRALHHKNIAIAWPEEMLRDDVDAVEWKPSQFDYAGIV